MRMSKWHKINDERYASQIRKEQPMMQTESLFVSSQVMPNFQIFLPKAVQEALGVTEDDQILWVVQENEVHIVNPALYAMQVFQTEMVDEAKKAGLVTDDEVIALVQELRKNYEQNDSI